MTARSRPADIEYISRLKFGSQLSAGDASAEQLETASSVVGAGASAVSVVPNTIIKEPRRASPSS